MKKLTIMLAGLGMAAAALPAAANAQAWVGVNQRQASLSQRIDQGIRSGALTRNEAFGLKTQLRGLVNLEYRYARSDGRLDMRERADLNRRFDAISRQVFAQKHDRQHRW